MMEKFIDDSKRCEDWRVISGEYVPTEEVKLVKFFVERKI